MTSMAERSAWIMVIDVLFFVESLSAMITLQAADAAGANARACLYKRLQTWTTRWTCGRQPKCHGSRPVFARQSLRPRFPRSEEHTSELQSLMRHSYAVF